MLNNNLSIQWQAGSYAHLIWYCKSIDCWCIDINTNGSIKRIETNDRFKSHYEFIQAIIDIQSRIFTVQEMIKLLKLGVFIIESNLQIDAYLVKKIGNSDGILKFGHLLSSDGFDLILDRGIDDDEVELTVAEFSELYKDLIWHVRDFDLM